MVFIHLYQILFLIKIVYDPVGSPKKKHCYTPPLYVNNKQELTKLYPSDKHCVSILSTYLYLRQIVSDKVAI